jgi:hypothetical protein
MKQRSLSMTGYFDKGKKTRREQFLAEMDKVVPWGRLCDLIQPHYPKGSPAGGRPPLPLERMLRIYCLQQWYNLSDPGAEEALYDSITMRQFAGVSTDADVIPDETSILNFRRLLEKHELTARLLAEINAHLGERGLFVGKGTIVDATIINAPSSTKNSEKERDPEMHQTRKGQQWYFGMKVHTGTDTDSGLVHTVVATSANVADVNVMGERKACTGILRIIPRRSRRRPKPPALNSTSTSAAPAAIRSRQGSARAIGACRAFALRSSIRSWWSSACGDMRRCATAESRRTWRRCTRCSPWPICTVCDTA